MGMALGKVTVETPNHVVVHKTDNYQIWRYPPTIAATVHAKDLNLSETATERDFTSPAFRSLARYIGVFGKPENRAPNAAAAATDASEQIAMTAPVEFKSESGAPATDASEQIAMTAPVEFKPQSVAMTAPVVMKPDADTNSSSVCDMRMSFFLPSKYSSIAEAPVPTNPAVKLVELPARYDAVLSFSGNLSMGTSQQYAETLLQQLGTDNLEVVGEWSYCGYNPPFTLPWLKRNEVHVPIDGTRFDSVTENVE